MAPLQYTGSPAHVTATLADLGVDSLEIFTTEEAGKVLAALNPKRSKPYSLVTVSRFCRDGKLPGARNMGRDWAIPRSAFAGFKFPQVGRPPNGDAPK